ncbi:MAG: MBL fold metallo-hydrolase [Alphaproteobacteria bacterium]|nr:MBL fold metallo-hydrolase [Alphaproteobacteria bacterium]MCW5741373.1 MBL fold metallo-hydrolase [Alphaproteobacteria bacterium]
MDRPAPMPVTFRLGEITVFRIKETLGRAFSPLFLLPAMDRDVLREHAGWLVPSHYDAEVDRFVMGTHSWVLKTKRHTILVDTCIGNQKFRPESPNFHMLDMPYLQRLVDAGLSVEDIDIVFCTHMHVDHVGWNTRLLNGRWVPTFPNAKYLYSRREFEWVKNRAGLQPDSEEAAIYNDSIGPIAAAGLAVIVDDGYEIEPGITLELASGHTPGSMVMRVQSGQGRAALVGDVCHHPLQVFFPEWNSAFCEDEDGARATRRRVLGSVASDGSLLMPAHFGAPHAVRVKAKGDRFEIPF